VAPSSEKALTCQAYDASTRSIVPTSTRSSSTTYTGREASKRAVEVYVYDLNALEDFSDLNATRGFSDLDVFEDFRTSTHSRIFGPQRIRGFSDLNALEDFSRSPAYAVGRDVVVANDAVVRDVAV
jgi:hypothetical protein